VEVELGGIANVGGMGVCVAVGKKMAGVGNGWLVGEQAEGPRRSERIRISRVA